MVSYWVLAHSAGFFDGSPRFEHLDFLPLLVAERFVLANELRLQIQFLRVFWTMVRNHAMVTMVIEISNYRRKVTPPFNSYRCDHAYREPWCPWQNHLHMVFIYACFFPSLYQLAKGYLTCVMFRYNMVCHE